MKGATTPFPRPRRPPIRLLVRTETMDVQRYLLMGAIAILSFMMLSKWSQFQDEQSLASTTAQHQARQEILQSGDDLPALPGEPSTVDTPLADDIPDLVADEPAGGERSEEHTSELQSRGHLVCRLLLEKKHTPHSG